MRSPEALALLPRPRQVAVDPARNRTLQLLRLVSGRELWVTWLVFAKELRELLVSRALWSMVLISAPLVGFSFIQAVRMYSQSSSNALRLPQLLPNINPLDGIVIPTFGAVYLMNTFLLPFVAIRAIGNEKQTGALKIALQLPIGINRLIMVKLAALAVGWSIALLPTLSALAIWALLLGGHIWVPELLTVLLGHALYALVIAGVAFLAAALTDSSATAAIAALSFTLGSWILEFAGSTGSGVLRAVAAFSLSPALRGLERGLLGSPTALTLFVLGLGFLALAIVWLPPGVSRRQKLVRSGAVFGVAAQALLLVVQLPIYADVSENQRNSFNPADMRELRQMTKELKVNVNLAANDTRLADLDRNVLSKLPRAMPHVTITYAETSTTSLFGGTSGATYGLTTYTYGGKQGVTRASTAREVLPLIEALDGRVVVPDATAAYTGYPLVSSAQGASVWFYGALPLLALGGWWYFQRAPQLPAGFAPLRVGRRDGRAPWRSAYLPALRTPVLVVGGVFLAIQLVPYGRGHTTFRVTAPAAGLALTAGVAQQYCPTSFAPGTESSMSLGALRTQVGGMLNDLDAALVAIASNDAAALRTHYGKFAGTYAGVAREIAELYPVRCPRLIADRLDGDAPILLTPAVDLTAVREPVVALRAGIASISNELGTRIQQASPDALVGNVAQSIDAPVVTGTPAWDNERTAALATRACAACHSNQPGWAWYSNLAPVSWLVQRDVDAGRSVLNFSEWDRPQPAAAQVIGSVQEGRMPPPHAGLLNGDVRLSDAERAELVSGLRSTFGGVPAAPSSNPAASASAALIIGVGVVMAVVGFALGRARRSSSVSLTRRTG